MVTLGTEGAVWCNSRGETGHRPARPVAVGTTSGAGDALLAGLVYGQVQGWELPQALAWAMACAEITLQSMDANAAGLSVAAVASCVAP